MPIKLSEKDLARINKTRLDRAKSKQPPPVSTGKLKRSIRPRQVVTRDELTAQLSETNLSATITANAEIKRGLFVIRLQSGGIPIDYMTKAGQLKRRYITFCKAGTPDKFFLPGVAVFVEVKKKGKKTKSHQTAVHTEIKRGGALCFTLDSFADYETVLAALDANAETVGKIRRLMLYLQNAVDLELAANKQKGKNKYVK